MADFYERQMRWQQDVHKEARREANKIQKQEVDDCTFQPTTNNKVIGSLKPRIAEDSSIMDHINRQQKGRKQKIDFQHRTEYRQYNPLPTANGPSGNDQSMQGIKDNGTTNNNPISTDQTEEQNNDSSPQSGGSAVLSELEASSQPLQPVARDESFGTSGSDLKGVQINKGRATSVPRTSSFSRQQGAEAHQTMLLQQLVDYLDGDAQGNGNEGAASLDEEESFFVQLQRERREWQKERAQLLSVIELQQRELEKRRIAVQEKSEEIASAFGNAVGGFEQRLHSVEQDIQFLRGRAGGSPTSRGVSGEMLSAKLEAATTNNKMEVLEKQMKTIQQKMDTILLKLDNSS